MACRSTCDCSEKADQLLSTNLKTLALEDFAAESKEPERCCSSLVASMDEEGEGLKEACGIMGCVLAPDTTPDMINVAHTIFLGLVALQHRGQEGAGIVVTDGADSKKFRYHKGQGLVHTIFKENTLAKLTGTVGLGHTRYSTAGGGDAVNTQPFVVHTRHGPMAVAHNGQLINASVLRETVLDRGVGLSTNSDSELITQILSLTPPRGEKSGPDWPARIRHLVEASPTSYSLAVMFEDKIYGVRDPYGNRPLCIGRLIPLHEHAEDKTLGWILSSESCAFQSLGAVHYKEVLPGEIVEISPDGVRTLDVVPRPKRSQYPKRVHIEIEEHLRNGIKESAPAFCIFEYIYFARADTIYEGQQVYIVRQRCGMQLAKESSVQADIVSSIPESATPAALGFAMQSRIPYAEVLCRNRYIGRSFILPDTHSRQLAVSKKFGAITENVVGKKIILCDDSIVRGNTIGPIIKLLRNAGAIEVHIRIASPPIKYPCYMGINIPTTSELVANFKNPEELAKFVGADSLVYLSIGGLVEAVKEGAEVSAHATGYCLACLDSNYPCQIDW